ncbi:hypothetical protein AXG93_2654s1060 [Marchantia polymorpha subsp. ruderalis]|uniref:Uncharacterized protein n=1 Tax=Marchantia polymorpha subsp. ruderalis TaxID=1480154 RepID=A0A176W480_MARPO|nr:hypothetical protein AXG93_2654s1060 [Marchantia polymorpha subsp. ruderalis]
MLSALQVTFVLRHTGAHPYSSQWYLWFLVPIPDFVMYLYEKLGKGIRRLQYFIPQGMKNINALIESAILEADRTGVKVISLGASNKVCQPQLSSLLMSKTFHEGNVDVLVPYPGIRLLSPDFSNQVEPIPIPVYNDVDDEPVPPIQYVRYLSFNGVETKNLSPPPNPDGTAVQEIENITCGNFSNYDNDDPNVEINRHAYCPQKEFLLSVILLMCLVMEISSVFYMFQLRDEKRPMKGEGVVEYYRENERNKLELFRIEHHFWGFELLKEYQGEREFFGTGGLG